MERPILFKPEMVRAILAGRKTQTRRVVKHIPMLGDPLGWCAAAKAQEPGWVSIVGDYRRFCPYGVPGDQLCVRHAFSLFHFYCKPIAGYEDIYGAGTDGNIYRIDKKELCPLKGTPTSKGYLCVSLSRNGHIKTHAIHVLICEAFYGQKISHGREVRHIDGNKDNNFPGNLDWGTSVDNWDDRRRLKRGIHADHHGAKLTEDQAQEIRFSALSQRALARRYSVSQSTIHYVKTGRTWADPCVTIKRNAPAWEPWKSPIHMPRWASRLSLRITDVRVERVQDISEADAMAEGVTVHLDAVMAGVLAEDSPARMEFWDLWGTIHGKDGVGWSENPWVWVIEFAVEPGKAT